MFAENDNSPAADLGGFTINAHALKSAAGSVGAGEISKQAAELEAAGKAGDIRAIKEKLPGFYELLKKTAEAIRTVLTEDEKSRDTEDGRPFLNAADAGVRDLVLELKTVTEAKDIEAIDRVTGELAGTRLDKETKKKLDAVSDLLLIAEFEEAITALDSLLKK
jgi:HPt (histidine-containing phosphotransfer) domain-containing protein